MKAEHLCSVDVREWARRGYLRGAGGFSWSWHRGEEPAGSIRVSVHGPAALTLAYTFGAGNDKRNVAERVNVVCTPCAYGGSRQWFACPRCARRVAVLYLRGGYFGCRLCKRVAYSSQSEDDLDRLWRRQHKIERRLDDHWQRPKGMRQQTYDRLFAELLECEERREGAFAMLAARLMGWR
ncbi:hypothetical protein GHT07_20225 [Caenimonas koreensis DSM 17982]|uniref:Uncharacterized protein n=1 Tax=Caenimonas koreensis DSM 17982 TaxID=1121255 RepID=A0A844AZ22_9BURK|nr:hypothetical protein [Caenimonas koreensis]MRD49605.1 hypothetical protein [Caenimonas koreensis DSM 17982]